MTDDAAEGEIRAIAGLTLPVTTTERARQRARTENMARLSRRRLALYALESPPIEVERPKTRGDCAGVERPCPFVACRHSLYLEVSPRNGSIKMRFTNLEPNEMPPDRSCVLDVADRGGVPLPEVGEAINVSRERARQIALSGLATLAADPRPDLPEGAMGAMLAAVEDEPRSERGADVADDAGDSSRTVVASEIEPTSTIRTRPLWATPKERRKPMLDAEPERARDEEGEDRCARARAERRRAARRRPG